MIASSDDPARPAFASLDLDWRLLLPTRPAREYRRLLLLGASAVTAAEVEAAGLASEVALTADRRAEAVVCLEGAGKTLEQAVALVDAGGVLYYESRAGLGPRIGDSPSRMLAVLRRGKLTPTGLYWVHPSFTGPRTYFPLDVAGALRWHLRNLHGSTAPFAAADRALDVLVRLDPRALGRVAPRLAVLAADLPAAATSPMPFPAEDLPDVLRGKGLRPLLLVHGAESTHAVMLPFGPAASEPLAVLKVRRSRDNGGMAEAQEVLAQLRASVDEPLRASLPEPLGTVESRGVTASIESFLQGQWLRARLARRRLPAGEAIEDLELAIDWIGDLHARFPLETRTWGEDDIREVVERRAASYVATLGTTTAEAELFAELRRRAHDLVDVPIPLVWRHGDFSSLNVLRDDNRIRVVDWEMAAPGLPLDDVLHFTRLWLYLARKADRPATFDAFRDLFLRPDRHDPLVDAGRSAIRRYVRRLGLDPRFVPLLLTAGCVGRAAGRAEDRPLLRDQPADPRERNRYVSYLGLISEHATQLFASPERWSAT